MPYQEVVQSSSGGHENIFSFFIYSLLDYFFWFQNKLGRGFFFYYRQRAVIKVCSTVNQILHWSHQEWSINIKHRQKYIQLVDLVFTSCSFYSLFDGFHSGEQKRKPGKKNTQRTVSSQTQTTDVTVTVSNHSIFKSNRNQPGLCPQRHLFYRFQVPVLSICLFTLLLILIIYFLYFCGSFSNVIHIRCNVKNTRWASLTA